MSIQKVIFSNLVYNEEYTRKTIPFLKSEYFQDQSDKVLFELINDYILKYNTIPTKESLLIDLSNKSGINEDIHKNIQNNIKSFQKPENTNLEWILNQTETFCQEKAIYNAIMQSIQILDDKSGNKSKGAIPQILSDALGISFNTSVGHDYIDNSENRFDFYNKVESRIPFDLEYFNKITSGGLPNKTLNLLMSSTGVGKSLFMCHFAAANLMQGKNVLYITLEMSEERIAERIDANLLDTPVAELASLSKSMYDNKIERVKRKTIGKLIIKEYPTSCAGSANFRYLLNELKTKRNFIPDIIYIDYLNICSSSRLKMGANVNSYSYIKAIAEELRGLAIEYNVPIISATQSNRNAGSDPELENVSESFGLGMTADLLLALINSEELSDLNQIMVKQLKNRYNDLNFNKRFVIGIDRSKMRLYDVESNAQDDIVFDNSKFGKEDSERNKKDKFKHFK